MFEFLHQAKKLTGYPIKAMKDLTLSDLKWDNNLRGIIVLSQNRLLVRANSMWLLCWCFFGYSYREWAITSGDLQMQFTSKKGNALLIFPQLADDSTDKQNINAGQISNGLHKCT